MEPESRQSGQDATDSGKVCAFAAVSSVCVHTFLSHYSYVGVRLSFVGFVWFPLAPDLMSCKSGVKVSRLLVYLCLFFSFSSASSVL